jgi:hypothetical protein
LIVTGTLRDAGPRIASVAAMLLLLTWMLAAPADANWTSTASGPASAKAAMIAPVGPNSLTSSCGLLRASVKLNWAATSSPWVDGYEILRGPSAGNYNSFTPIAGSSTTYTTPALPLGTYYFVVRATKGSWRSTNSNEVSRTIVSVLGLGTCL